MMEMRLRMVINRDFPARHICDARAGGGRNDRFDGVMTVGKVKK